MRKLSFYYKLLFDENTKIAESNNLIINFDTSEYTIYFYFNLKQYMFTLIFFIIFILFYYNNILLYSYIKENFINEISYVNLIIILLLLLYVVLLLYLLIFKKTKKERKE